MKEELNKLLREYMARLRDFSNESADFLSDQMYSKMQGVFIREFDNELKLLKKKNDFVSKTSSRIYKLVYKALKRDCKTESKDISTLDFVEVISDFLPYISLLQQGDVKSLQKFQFDPDFIEAFQQFYAEWKTRGEDDEEPADTTTAEAENNAVDAQDNACEPSDGVNTDETSDNLPDTDGTSDNLSELSESTPYKDVTSD